MRQREWKATELKDITHRRDNLGQKWADIAKAYNSTEGAVKGVYHYRTRTLEGVRKRKQAKKRNWSKDDKQMVLSLLESGYSRAAVGRFLRTTESAIDSLISRMRAES